MNKLPKLFKNESINPTNHNKIKTIVKNINTEDKNFVLNKIFNDKNYYDIRVIIKTKNEEFEDYLLGKTNKNIYTLSNRIIPIEEIIYIKIKD